TRHLFAWSAACVSFEPRSGQAAKLASDFGALYPRVRIEAAALSDQSGQAVLRVFITDAPRSTMEAENLLEESKSVLCETVSVRRLDEFDFDNIGFVKIDVEGHEEAVLCGGIDTIRRTAPNLLIEIEERHKKGAIRRVTELLKAERYVGYFLLDGRIRPA